MYQQDKIITSLFLLLLTLSIFGNSSRIAFALLTPSLNVIPSTYIANSLGETVPIQVNAYMYNVNLTGFQFQLKFNTTLLRCLNASLGSFFPHSPNSTSTVTVDNGTGTISIQAYLKGSTPPVNGWGPLLSVNFNATHATTYPRLQDTTDTCPLQIANDILYGTGNQTISHNAVSGTYKAPYIPPLLNLTLNTDKIKYYYEDRINVNGTFTGNGYPIPDALVALEIQDPGGVPAVARTYQTSSIQVSCPLQITALTPCDMGGTPQSSFSVGYPMYFEVDLQNVGSSNLNALVTVNPYDSSNATLGVSALPITVPAGDNTSVILSLPLDYGSPLVLTPATSGNATVYASVWTDHIGNGGVPLALERAAMFTITGTSQGSPFFTNLPPQGTYQTNLRVHFKKGAYSGRPPTYTINVGASFMGENATQNKQTQITIAGDVNVDDVVDLRDLVLLANAYGSKPGDPRWNPIVDVNGDGAVNLADLVLLANNYGKGTI